MNHGQSSEMMIDQQASTSHVSSSADPMETYSPPSYQVKMESDHPSAGTALPVLADSNDSYWSMEDLWSMQLLNGD